MPVIGMSHSELLTLISFSSEELNDISPAGDYLINDDMKESDIKKNIQSLLDNDWLMSKDDGAIRINNAIEPALGVLINPNQVIQLHFVKDKADKKIYLLEKNNYWVIYTVSLYGHSHTMEYPFTNEKIYNWIYNLFTLPLDKNLESIPNLQIDLSEKDMVALGIIKAIYERRLQTGIELEGEYTYISFDVIKKFDEAQSLLNTIFESFEELEHSYENLIEKGLLVSKKRDRSYYGYSDLAKKVFDPGVTAESVLIKTSGKKEGVQTIHIMKNGLVINKVNKDNNVHIKTCECNIEKRELFNILFQDAIELASKKNANKRTSRNEICLKCGQAIKPGAKFCPGCGSKLEDTNQKFCGSCGTKVLASQKFCKNCGNKQSS